MGGTATSSIKPSSAWHNLYVESFNARMRDEVLDVELFDELAEAKVILADRLASTTQSTHTRRGMQSPEAFVRAWSRAAFERAGCMRASDQRHTNAGLSLGVDRRMGSGHFFPNGRRASRSTCSCCTRTRPSAREWRAHSRSSRLAQHDLDRIGKTTSRLFPRVLFGFRAGGEAHFVPTVRVRREKMQALRY